ncbi:MAG: DUF2254 domain-containing protein [Deltaproteobacteria bacterium]|nr:DUF2254 domain-containing protein [Deltaproteobacteria bacterium]
MAQALERRKIWLYPVLLLGGVALAWFGLLLGADQLLSGGRGVGVFGALARYSAEDMQSALGNLPEVVVAILGIAITVVSIILQLSATRYTPRVTELFFRDRTNLLLLSFFVVTSIHAIWATFAVHRTYTPHVLIVVTLVMMTAAVLLLIPYFSYVFAFLEPERVVARLQEHSLAEALAREAAPGALRQGRVLQGIEQLADVAVNAVAQKDRIIASRSVDALKDLCTRYVAEKQRLEAEWFELGEALRSNPDFVVLGAASHTELLEQRTWLEWKVLRQYQTIFNESLNRMAELAELVGIDSRYIGETALQAGDRPVLRLTIKFFNTYLRATINRRDVRTAYNVLHQYRQLAEGLARAGWGAEVLELGAYFKYYGQTASAAGLPFVTETAAYDLCALCEVAHQVGFSDERKLLQTFLEVDKAAETEAEERSLRGVRKAQLKLATYYLLREGEELARLIFRDMEHERPERLASIRDELLAVKDRDFWEIIDRGHNFEYLEPERKAQLERFYAWFGEKGAA